MWKFEDQGLFVKSLSRGTALSFTLLPTHPYTHPSSQPPIHTFTIHICSHPSIHSRIHPCIHLSTQPASQPYIHKSMYPSIYPPSQPASHTFTNPRIHPSIRPCTHACMHVSHNSLSLVCFLCVMLQTASSSMVKDNIFLHQWVLREPCQLRYF